MKTKAAKPRVKAALSPKAKFNVMREDMKESLIERDDEVDIVLCALLCGEHPLLVGPPGTAKSLLLDTIMRWIDGGSGFSILFNKFTTPEEVFGPISVLGLKSDVYRRVTTNKLPEADVAFADEIFKASTAILNTMLRILNERMFENGDGTFRKVPLQICVAASNEWPNEQDGGKELGALFDRFLFRKTVRPISKAGRSRLLWERDHQPSLRDSITPEEIKEAQEEAMELEFTPAAMEAFEEILDQLNAEGIRPGDRRCYKAVNAAKAFAYLCGDEDVEVEHLDILSHVLWDDPTEQPEVCARIVGRLANPTGTKITDLLIQAQDVLDKSSPTEAVPKLQTIQKELKSLPAHAKLEAAQKYVGQEIKRMYDLIVGV